jgi:Cys-tRNA(Pro) deacylase
MSATARFPATPATRMLEAAGVAFEGHVFPYVEKGGTRHSSAVLGVDEHAVIKTLMFEGGDREPLCVLMHGDRLVSEKQLARAVEQRTIRPCEPATAERHSGYQVGGTSPFGLRKPMPIFAEATIFDLPRIWINGGRRGFLVSMAPAELDRLLKPARVAVALARS